MLKKKLRKLALEREGKGVLQQYRQITKNETVCFPTTAGGKLIICHHLK